MLEIIPVRITHEEVKFGIPIRIVSVSISPVTKHSNIGIDTEYVARNDDLDIKGRGSNEERAKIDFQNNFREKCVEVYSLEERKLSFSQLYWKRKVELYMIR